MMNYNEIAQLAIQNNWSIKSSSSKPITSLYNPDATYEIMISNKGSLSEISVKKRTSVISDIVLEGPTIVNDRDLLRYVQRFIEQYSNMPQDIMGGGY